MKELGKLKGSAQGTLEANQKTFDKVSLLLDEMQQICKPETVSMGDSTPLRKDAWRPGARFFQMRCLSEFFRVRF